MSSAPFPAPGAADIAVSKRDVVVVGASAGGVEALRELVSELPAGFPAAVLIVLHVPANGSSALPAILSRVSPLSARHARSDDTLEHGVILVAPPDRHLVVHRNGVTVSHGPKENGHRPAVDVLFRSAARAYGSRVISVVLSGALDDGAAGTVAVTLQGGLGMAQDPAEALHASMPRAAIAAAGLDSVLPVKAIAGALVELVQQDAPTPTAPSELMEMEVDMSDLDLEALTEPDRPGEPSGWTCPDCHGSLFTIEEGGFVRFRCRVGHAWSADSLLAQQSASMETALWVALRTLEEKVSLTLRLGRRATARGHTLTGEQFERQAEEAQRSASLLRALIESMSGASDDVPRAAEST
jgi:two-component system chemotaxis response regulator CheB